MSLSDLMPPVEGRRTVNHHFALNHNIIDTLHKNYWIALKQTEKIAPKFKGHDAEDTARNIWKFLKEQIRYVKDDSESQDIRLPNRFVADGYGDCKSYSLFAASILGNLGLPVIFRYASYRDNPTPTHVYVYTFDNEGNQIIIDGVYSRFNSQKPFKFKKDYKMRVSTLSGLGDDSGRIRQDYASKLLARYLRFTARNPKAIYRAALLRNKLIQLGKLQGSLTPIPTKALERISKGNDPLFRSLALNAHAQSEGYSPASIYRGNVRIQDLDSMDGIFGIDDVGFIKVKKIFKKIGRGIKKVGKAAGKVGKAAFGAVKKLALAPARNAFLLMVKLNFRGLASKLAAANRSKVEHTWKRLGGSPSALYAAIGKGRLTKAAVKGLSSLNGIGTVDGVGALPLATALALAGPILAAFAAILKAVKAKPEETGASESETSYDKIMEDVAAAGGPTSFPPGALVTDSDTGAGEGAGVPDEEDIKQEAREASNSSFSLGGDLGKMLMWGGGAFLAGKALKLF